ncbi:MAG: HtaA domain-containing protein [Thermoleophilia bacterium]|nr:HtaA domain-containing protein [Thermoleophilia bacterium]MDH3724757.1 HtaA domain-containing protein [Thermoleophilia bacterium]
MAEKEQSKAEGNGSTTRGGEGAWVLEVSEPTRGRVMRASLPISGFGAPDVEVLESPEDEAGYRDPFARHVTGGQRSVRRLEAPTRPAAKPETVRRNNLLWGLGAIAAAIVLVGGLAILISALGDDDEANQASGGGAVAAPASLGGVSLAGFGDACRVKFDRAVIGPPPLPRLQALGVSLQALRPGIATSQAQYAFPVRSSNNVVCGELGGTVGLRGGLRFSTPAGALDMRRFRIDGETGLIRTYARAGALAGTDRVTLDLDKGRWVQGSEFVTFRVPVELTSRGAADLNSALDLDDFAQGDEVGILSLTGQARVVTDSESG